MLHVAARVPSMVGRMVYPGVHRVVHTQGGIGGVHTQGVLYPACLPVHIPQGVLYPACLPGIIPRDVLYPPWYQGGYIPRVYYTHHGTREACQGVHYPPGYQGGMLGVLYPPS